MKKTSYIILALLMFLGIFGLAKSSWAACTGGGTSCTKSGTIYTCTDAYYGCIQDAVTAATAGDTINITAVGSVTWPQFAVNIPANKPLKLKGPGASNLTINLSTGKYVGDCAIQVGASITNTGVEITGFRFYSNVLNNKSCAIRMEGQNWRVHHNIYDSYIDGTDLDGGLFVVGSGMHSDIELTGLVDNNIVYNGRVAVGGPYSFAKMGAIYLEPTALGTNNAVYIEDNQFLKTTSSATLDPEVTDSNYAGGYVFRYNTVDNRFNLIHSLQSDDSRGMRRWEFYGNSYTTNHYRQGAIGIGSGTGVIFNNSFINDTGGNYVGYIQFFTERIGWSDGAFGTCDGTSQVDGNTPGRAGWPCRDQIGRGKDVSLWDVSTNLPAPAQASEPAYIWNVRIDGSIPGYPPELRSESVGYILENRDYYWHNSSFNGTSGVGCGTLANRPATCTTGVGYWATEQSCTNMTGMVGANPPTPIAGTLYKCTAPNTWAAYYTPYTYPHPLQGGTQPSVLYGDVSTDGTISAYDASLAAQYAVGLITLTSTQISAADVSGDGTVSAYDASLIAQKAVGLITKFPVEGG